MDKLIEFIEIIENKHIKNKNYIIGCIFNYYGYIINREE